MNWMKNRKIDREIEREKNEPDKWSIVRNKDSGEKAMHNGKLEREMNSCKL